MALPPDSPAPPATAPALSFSVEGAEALRHAASPALRFDLGVAVEGERLVHSVLLDVQVRIAARQRSYSDAEETRLQDLFGLPEQWKTSLQSLLWTNATVLVPSFRRLATAALILPCSYDFEIAAARYLSALEDGEIPLEFLFSGTIFHEGEGARWQVARLPLDSEATFRLPVGVWREAMDAHFPDGAWLALQRHSFDRLYAYRSRNALPSWEAVVDSLLEGRE